jgi:DNA-binding LacI/PurR family transcriptional regulator
LADHGIPFDPELVYEGDFTQASGYHGVLRMLDLPDLPTAVFASNDVSAMGVLDAARVRGLNLPGDLSVVGFDDIPLAASLNPPLTTVRQPLREMGQIATQMLLDRIQDPEQDQSSITLSTELIVRSSTARSGRLMLA